MSDDDESSDPCFAHLLVDGHPVDPGTARDVARFRRAERERLYAARRTLPSDERAALTASLHEALSAHLTPTPGMRIAAYWPIRGEPDLRAWMKDAAEAGAEILLPLVEEKNAPLVFRRWWPGCPMRRGAWNIPEPDGTDVAVPDVVISPLVGVDDALYRLGNGGGYYDRTLARLDPPARVIGVGFPFCRIATIFPMPWDVPMDSVVLADGQVMRRG